MNYTFTAAGRPVGEPIVDLNETDDHPRCTGPRHVFGGPPRRIGGTDAFVSVRVAPSDKIPDHNEWHAECYGSERCGRFKRLTLEKTIRLCLHEQSPVRVAPTFLDLNGLRLASTNASLRSASARGTKSPTRQTRIGDGSLLRRSPFENPRSRKYGFLLMFVHVRSPARSPTRRLWYGRVGLLAAP